MLKHIYFLNCNMHCNHGILYVTAVQDTLYIYIDTPWVRDDAGLRQVELRILSRVCVYSQEKMCPVHLYC